MQTGSLISYAEVNAGHLRFVPGLNESSTHAANGNGAVVGNMKGDYASIGYQISDGANLSNGSKLVIDVAAVADKPTVNLSLVGNGIPLYNLSFPSAGITTGQFQSGNFDKGALGITKTLTDSSSGQDQVNGTSGNDYIVSQKGGGDSLVGNQGNDILVGSDAIQGDSLYGGEGNDILVSAMTASMAGLARISPCCPAIVPTTPSRRARDIRTTTSGSTSSCPSEASG